MEYLPLINTVVIIIGFLLTWLFQRQKISSLETALGSMRDFHSVFDINKIKEYVSLKEEMSSIEAEKKLQEMMSKSPLGPGNVLTPEATEQAVALVMFLLELLKYVPSPFRGAVIERHVQNIGLRAQLFEALGYFEEIYLDPQTGKQKTTYP